MSSQIESSLLQIVPRPARERRLIFLGQRTVENDFYSYLAAIGKLYYTGGIPTIAMGPGASLRMLRKFLRKRSDAKGFHALTLTLKRDRGGLIGKLIGGLRNHLPGFLSGRHHLHIVVAGSEETVEAQLDELGAFLQALEARGYVSLENVPKKHGRIAFNPRKVLCLHGKASLLNVIWFVRQKTGDTSGVDHHALAQALSSVAPSGGRDFDDRGVDPATGLPTGVNPATGLPMVEGTMNDVMGNTYGFDNTRM